MCAPVLVVRRLQLLQVITLRMRQRSAIIRQIKLINTLCQRLNNNRVTKNAATEILLFDKCKWIMMESKCKLTELLAVLTLRFLLASVSSAADLPVDAQPQAFELPSPALPLKDGSVPLVSSSPRNRLAGAAIPGNH